MFQTNKWSYVIIQGKHVLMNEFSHSFQMPSSDTDLGKMCVQTSLT